MRQQGRPDRAAAVLLAVALGLAGCSGSPLDPTPGGVSESPTTVPAERSPSPQPADPTSPATPAPTPSPTPTAGSRSSTAAPAPTRPAAKAPLIVIDPGHSGRSIRSTEARTGLRDIDYPNYPEIYEVFDVSVCVQQGLLTDGYRVELTKTKALDSVSLAKRAAVANQAKAALAISVHDDHSQTAGFQATYSQRGIKHGGSYHPLYRGTGSHRTVFSNPTVASASEKAAATIARERAVAQGRPVTVRENSFTGRAPLEPGNLALVQLLSQVPWVYNEAGAKSGTSTTRAMSIGSETAYAKGLLTGVESAVPLPAGRVKQPSAGAKGLRSCLVRRVEPSPGRFTRPRRYLPDGR